MVGASGVGKTSLVDRYVSGVFSERYLTTVGVRISKKRLRVDDGPETELLLWDLNGEDRFQRLSTSYLRGMAGYFVVLDGTRHTTVDVGLDLRARIAETYVDIPFVVLLNKSDLRQRWEPGADRAGDLEQRGWKVVETSAKTGAGVETAFLTLGDMIMERS